MDKEQLHAGALSAITRTIHRYAHAVDEIDRDTLIDTFTSDGCVEATVAHGDPVPRLVGPQAIADFIMSGRRSQGDRRRHLVTNLWIDKLTANTAVAHSYHVIVIADEGAVRLKSMGTYEDDMVRCPDGEWRTALKRVTLDAPY